MNCTEAEFKFGLMEASTKATSIVVRDKDKVIIDGLMEANTSEIGLKG